MRGIDVAITIILMTAVAGTAPGQSARPSGSTDATTFEVRIENVARRALKLSSGGAADIPFSPGVWVIHTGTNPILTPGVEAPRVGLEGLAEAGMADAFASNLRSLNGVRSSGAFSTPLGRARGKMGPSPSDGGGRNVSRMLQVGQRFEFTVVAQPGDMLSLALMIAQSNDGVVGSGKDGVALFDASGRPVSGDITMQLGVWDVGTEVNEDPGLGPNQGLRQGAAHAGDPERAPVRPIGESPFGDRWPRVAGLLRVTISPKSGS
jgi:hypothetical protein